jgi:hypothetical protein
MSSFLIINTNEVPAKILAEDPATNLVVPTNSLIEPAIDIIRSLAQEIPFKENKTLQTIAARQYKKPMKSLRATEDSSFIITFNGKPGIIIHPTGMYSVKRADIVDDAADLKPSHSTDQAAMPDEVEGALLQAGPVAMPAEVEGALLQAGPVAMPDAAVPEAGIFGGGSKKRGMFNCTIL